MRFRIFATAGVALASAAVLAVPALARTHLTHQVNVTVKNTGCSLQLRSVSHRNTTIVFQVVNLGSKPAGIVIYGLKSRFAAPKVGASDLEIRFRGPGRYAYKCVRGSYLHPTKLESGVFTIRKK